MVHPPGVAALRRWGLLDRLLATGCPPIDTYRFDFGPLVISGAPGTADSPLAYGPRRTVLDKLLVDAASEAGAEVREEFTVDQVLFEDGRVTGIRGREKNGKAVAERATVVVGADGRHSPVAEAVKPETYHERPPILAGYYSYWSGIPAEGAFEVYSHPYRGFAAWSTNDGLTLVVGGWPMAEFEANRKDVEGNWMKMIDLPGLAARLRAGKRTAVRPGHGRLPTRPRPAGPTDLRVHLRPALIQVDAASPWCYHSFRRRQAVRLGRLEGAIMAALVSRYAPRFLRSSR